MTTQRTLFDTGLTPEAAEFQSQQPGPTPRKRHADCLIVLGILRACESVSSLRLRAVLPCSATQRISDLRDDGYVIDCQRPSGSACGLYTLKNREHRGQKFF